MNFNYEQFLQTYNQVEQRTDEWFAIRKTIISATDGRSGGERSQYMLRNCLTPFDCKLIQSPEVLIANSSRAFSNNGEILDQKSNQLLDSLLEKLYQNI